MPEDHLRRPRLVAPEADEHDVTAMSGAMLEVMDDLGVARARAGLGRGLAESIEFVQYHFLKEDVQLLQIRKRVTDEP